MSVEWVAGLLVVLAVVALGGAALLFFRGEAWLMQWLRGTAGVLLASLALYLVFIAASLFSYLPAPDTDPLATLSFQKSGEQSWNVTVAEPDGSARVYDLKGELWQLDVRLLRHTGLGGIFSTGPSYQLERLTGRYLAEEDEASKDHSEHRLVSDPFLGYDIWQQASEHGSFLVTGVRSGVSLVPAADGAIFGVALDEEGLLALKAMNSVAEDALKSVSE